MSGFTEGPWERNSDGELIAADGKCVGVWGLGVTHVYRSEEAEANSKLISASPLMIAALQKIQFRCECFLEDDRDMKKHSIEAIKAICDAAIDKALVQ